MIIVDPPLVHAHGRLWAHLASDTSYEELHAFAARVGLPRQGFDGDHYDLPADRLDAVLAAGAVLVGAGDLARRLNGSGLRFRKRKGERPLSRSHDTLPGAPVPHRLDLIRSHLAPPESTTVGVATFVFDARDDLAMVRPVRRPWWEAPAGRREPGESPREAAVREIAEETGLIVHADWLRACAYERIELTPQPEGIFRHPVNHVAVFTVRLRAEAPVLTPGDDATDAAWLTPGQCRARCGDAPWWPILDDLLIRNGL